MACEDALGCKDAERCLIGFAALGASADLGAVGGGRGAGGWLYLTFKMVAPSADQPQLSLHGAWIDAMPMKLG